MSKVLCVIGIVSAGLIWLLIMACCVVEIISRHLVVFRRSNGMTESRTFVELCQMDRGLMI